MFDGSDAGPARLQTADSAKSVRFSQEPPDIKNLTIQSMNAYGSEQSAWAGSSVFDAERGGAAAPAASQWGGESDSLSLDARSPAALLRAAGGTEALSPPQMGAAQMEYGDSFKAVFGASGSKPKPGASSSTLREEERALLNRSPAQGFGRGALTPTQAARLRPENKDRADPELVHARKMAAQALLKPYLLPTDLTRVAVSFIPRGRNDPESFTINTVSRVPPPAPVSAVCVCVYVYASAPARVRVCARESVRKGGVKVEGGETGGMGAGGWRAWRWWGISRGDSEFRPRTCGQPRLR